MSISREELNNYYNKVNSLVDDYVEKWKIRPSQLKRYFKPGSENFNRLIERSGISNYNGAKQILIDVLDDRLAEEQDGVITFESFKLYESSEFKYSSVRECLYRGINRADITMEKSLADYFDTNLGDIDIVDAEKHIFSINDWQGDNLQVVVYSSDEVETILGNLVDFIFEDLMQKKIEIISNISLNVSSLISDDSAKEEIRGKIDKMKIDLITEIIGSGFNYETKSGKFHLWVN